MKTMKYFYNRENFVLFHPFSNMNILGWIYFFAGHPVVLFMTIYLCRIPPTKKMNEAITFAL